MTEKEKKKFDRSNRLCNQRRIYYAFFLLNAVILTNVTECSPHNSDLVISSDDVMCALLDSMYVNKDFDNEIAKSLEITKNFATDPAFEFGTKFPLAILACLDGFEAYAGSIIPVMLDTVKEEFENKGSLARIIIAHETRTEIRKSIIDSNIIIVSILDPLKTMKNNIVGVCSHLEASHRDLFKIVMQLSSRNYDFRKFPSATSQLLLQIAPITTMIAQQIPYLEWNTKANCKLRSLFEDLFRHAVLHRLQKVDLACVESSQCEFHYNDLISSTMKNELNVNISKPEQNYIRCSKNRKGDFTIKDNLEFIRSKGYTHFHGDMSCVQDYFSLLRYRIESHFAKAVNMLDRRCSNSRGTKTGNLH